LIFSILTSYVSSTNRESADRQVYSPSKEVEREIEGKIAEFLKVYSERGADTGEVSFDLIGQLRKLMVS